MMRRIWLYGTVVIAGTLVLLGGFVYSQNVPYVPGPGEIGQPKPVDPVGPPKKKVPRKYCKTVNRPPERINMCIRGSYGDDPICTNYCVEVTQAGKYCDESPNSSCQAKVEEKDMDVVAAGCFETLVSCGCQSDWQRRRIRVKFMTCD